MCVINVLIESCSHWLTDVERFNDAKRESGIDVFNSVEDI